MIYLSLILWPWIEPNFKKMAPTAELEHDWWHHLIGYWLSGNVQSTV